MAEVKDFYSGLRWVGVKNQNAAAVPGNAVMRVAGTASTGEFLVDQPNADGQDGCLINSPTMIQATAGAVIGYGLATQDTPWWALYDSADGAPAAGETWGPGNGSWKLRKGKPGYLIYGGADGTKVLVTRAGATSADPTHFIDVVTCVSIVVP